MDFERLKCGKSDLRLGLFGVEEQIPRKQDAVFLALYGKFTITKAEKIIRNSKNVARKSWIVMFSLFCCET
jgi:hypothetical protein